MWPCLNMPCYVRRMCNIENVNLSVCDVSWSSWVVVGMCKWVISLVSRQCMLGSFGYWFIHVTEKHSIKNTYRVNKINTSYLNWSITKWSKYAFCASASPLKLDMLAVLQVFFFIFLTFFVFFFEKGEWSHVTWKRSLSCNRQ